MIDPYDAEPRSPQNAPGAVAALVLGILGILVCPLLGPFAWLYGRRGQQAVDASGGLLAGRGLATTGKVLGIVGTLLIVLLLVALLVLLGAGSRGGEVALSLNPPILAANPRRGSRTSADRRLPKGRTLWVRRRSTLERAHDTDSSTILGGSRLSAT